MRNDNIKRNIDKVKNLEVILLFEADQIISIKGSDIANFDEMIDNNHHIYGVMILDMNGRLTYHYGNFQVIYENQEDIIPNEGK